MLEHCFSYLFSFMHARIEGLLCPKIPNGSGGERDVHKFWAFLLKWRINHKLHSNNSAKSQRGPIGSSKEPSFSLGAVGNQTNRISLWYA